jgi:hypothetical protein
MFPSCADSIPPPAVATTCDMAVTTSLFGRLKARVADLPAMRRPAAQE